MSGERCMEFGRRQAPGGLDGDTELEWREHLAGCADCRDQSRADALLRGALAAPPPPLSPGFEADLRRRLERRGPAAQSSPRPGRLRRSGLWLLAVYGTAAAATSVTILARLPWEALPAAPALGVLLGVMALATPLVLLDRRGVLLPPGPAQR